MKTTLGFFTKAWRKAETQPAPDAAQGNHGIHGKVGIPEAYAGGEEFGAGLAEGEGCRLETCDTADLKSALPRKPALPRKRGREIREGNHGIHGIRGKGGFTMVEIAIAIAVIAFALVAIVSILPTGLQVQRDNREETIINNDGMYWLEAIRSGNAGSYELANFVESVTDNTTGQVFSNLTTLEILGRLSVNQKPEPRAKVRAITGAAIERDHNSIGFEYFLDSRLKPSGRNTNMFDLWVVLRWPVLQNGNVGNGKKTFHTLVSGHVIQTNGFSIMEANAYGPSTPPIP